MQNVSLEVQQDIAIVRLTNGVTNAISPQLVADLAAALGQVQQECRGMVLAGGDKFFSNGFDLPSLLALDRDGFSDFFEKFNQVILSAYTLPIPTACAIRGHAPGGGTIFALAGDFRYMAEGKKRIGLNEVMMGLPVPYLADLILQQVVGNRAATGMLYAGELMLADHAARIGLVDTLLPDAEVERHAVEKVLVLASRPPSGFAAIKANQVESVQCQYQLAGQNRNREFVECWFLPEVQAQITKAAEKF